MKENRRKDGHEEGKNKGRKTERVEGRKERKKGGGQDGHEKQMKEEKKKGWKEGRMDIRNE